MILTVESSLQPSIREILISRMRNLEGARGQLGIQTTYLFHFNNVSFKFNITTGFDDYKSDVPTFELVSSSGDE